ncbi:hypothetical protein [Streptomyces endophyticus]|uniref:Uncharacterized protein n=1 Tax=Streptomyces endophyticus TaxID=714166 RepID=A0ABU6F508_9ACTN|nr:hypothetical protein [Streptomyces endophyticus]MEB8339074.1 hypothetical protein [Streptomyces endophyticus]
MAFVIALLLSLPLLASGHSFASAHAPVAAPADAKACHGDGTAPQGPAEAVRTRDRHRAASGSSQLPCPFAESPAPDNTAVSATAPHASYVRPDRSIDELTAASLQVFRC